MRRCHWIGWVGAAAAAADTKKPARSALFDGGLVVLRALMILPSLLAVSFQGWHPCSSYCARGGSTSLDFTI